MRSDVGDAHMGHERLGLLPRTRKWRQIVEGVSGWSSTEEAPSAIAADTLRHVRSRFQRLGTDAGANAAFGFLVSLAGACRVRNPLEQLRKLGIRLPNQLTALSLAGELRRCVEAEDGEPEYAAIAQGAAVDAITQWYACRSDDQRVLFDSHEDPFNVWRSAGTGAGFCELARHFFAGLTTRYLCYFLDREASACLADVEERERFQAALREHVEDVSKHAFETARITQSFAAGWFNKHIVAGPPEEETVRRFLSFALTKMREELAREGASG